MVRVRVNIPKNKKLSGARLLDFEFGDWRDFFILPEDKFKVLKSLDSFRLKIEYPVDKFEYAIDGISKNLRVIKFFIPTKPAKHTWFYIDEDPRIYYQLDKIELVDFGYNVTVNRRT